MSMFDRVFIYIMSELVFVYISCKMISLMWGGLNGERRTWTDWFLPVLGRLVQMTSRGEFGGAGCLALGAVGSSKNRSFCVWL